MAEELKHLIEQIQKEGVEKAEKEAADIISHARKKAAVIISGAEARAKKTQEKAETESKAFAERSVKTLEQAARDLLITVGQGCEKVVTETLGKKVSTVHNVKFLQQMILTIIEQSAGSEDVVLTVSDADLAALNEFSISLVQKTKRKIELVSDSEILSGFKIGFKNKNVYLDYTDEALAEALAAFLRPELARTVSGVAREQTSK